MDRYLAQLGGLFHLTIFLMFDTSLGEFSNFKKATVTELAISLSPFKWLAVTFGTKNYPSALPGCANPTYFRFACACLTR
jgi:hypothetical protein